MEKNNFQNDGLGLFGYPFLDRFRSVNLVVVPVGGHLAKRHEARDEVK